MTEQTWRMIFAERLVQHMTQRQMTRKELAASAGISQMTISRYLNGQQSARIDIILRLAKALNCSVDDLVAVDEPVEC